LGIPRTATIRAKNAAERLGFEAKLWLTADKLRNNMDSAEYKHIVLGLIFLLPCFGGRIGDIAVYGEESNSTTRLPAMMNLAIRGIKGDLDLQESRLEAANKSSGSLDEVGSRETFWSYRPVNER